MENDPKFGLKQPVVMPGRGSSAVTDKAWTYNPFDFSVPVVYLGA